MGGIFTWDFWFEQLASYWFVALMGGAGFLLQKYRRHWADRLLYTLGAAAIATVIVVGNDARHMLRGHSPITEDTAEQMVNDWCIKFGYTIQKANETGVRFHYHVETVNKQRVEIAQFDDSLQYLQLATGVTITASNPKDSFSKWPQVTYQRLLLTLQNELAKQGVEYSGVAGDLDGMKIMYRIPISDALTEYEFEKAVSKIETALIITRNIIGLEAIGLKDRKMARR